MCWPASARAEGDPSGVAMVLLIESLFAGLSFVSSGAASSGDDVRTVPRIVGGVEIGIAVLSFVAEANRGQGRWATHGVITGLGVYNLATRGGIAWRFATNELGLHAIFLGEYVDERISRPGKSEPSPQTQLTMIPGGLALIGRF
jgi:hypothetical protein